MPFIALLNATVGVSDLKISPYLVPRLAQSVRVGIASFNIVHDRRDDPVDPHKGMYSTIDLALATKYFGSQANFARVLGRNATYYSLGPKFVLAREHQFGIEPAWNVPSTDDPTDPIPLPERFLRWRRQHHARLSAKPGPGHATAPQAFHWAVRPFSSTAPRYAFRSTAPTFVACCLRILATYFPLSVACLSGRTSETSPTSIACRTRCASGFATGRRSAL